MMKKIKMKMRHPKAGFILPATILLSLGVAIISGMFLQFVATSSESLNTRTYNTIAREAARSGIEYVNSCLTEDTQSAWTVLTPATDCDGSVNGGSQYLHKQGTEWRSTFSVSQPDNKDNVVSTGTVEILSGSTVVKRYTATEKMSIGGLYTTLPASTGETVTDIKNDNTDCAIANGKLYCWGDNTAGQLGQGDTTNRSTPTLVGGALAGKTVTKVTVAQQWQQLAGIGVNTGATVCAIADGTPYCWGDNSFKQLGYSGGDLRTPTADVPRTSSGPLAGQTVVDISTAPTNNPASFIWPYAKADPHSCALTADGAMACWGDGDFRQLTGGGAQIQINWVCDPIFGWICVPVPGYYWDYPSHTYPTLVKGYSDTSGPFAGKKAVRVGASSHDSCLVAEGELFCMGVPAPLNILCNSVLFSGASDTLLWAFVNPCIGGFSNGYNVSSAAFWGLVDTPLSGNFINPYDWELSSNETCMMADTNFVCFGQSPAFNATWLDAWQTPWVALSNADVTSHDNGDNTESGGILAIYCAINKGVAYCSATLANAYDGAPAVANWRVFNPVGKTGSNGIDGLNGTDGIDGTRDDMIPTVIAAGLNHGCLAANGQLLCWGSGYSLYPQVRTGSIGTAAGTLAANGPVSTSENHSCGIINGQLFCWGDNSKGQLGMGNYYNLSQPQALPAFVGKYVTHVSTGKNHTCAVVYAKAYCWGDNSSGQLGNGTTNSTNEPDFAAPVAGALANKRVTAISAGDNNTCAIANDQAYCWGDNSHKKLGDGTTTQRNSPVLVNGHGTLTTGMDTTDISVGSNHTCAIANADAYCWGWNQNGRTGLGINSNTDSDPTRLTGGTAGTPRGPINGDTGNNLYPSVSGIAAGGEFSCGIFNARLSCWGKSDVGQTGTNSTADRTVPTLISGSAGGYYATAVSAGDKHVCAIINGNLSATNGNIWCWGEGADGRLGNGGTGDSLVPVLINGGATTSGGVRRVASQISAGGATSCSVANGNVLCWGEGSDGQLGNALSIDSTLPVRDDNFRFITPYERGPVF